ncbi:MAG: phage holin family protein [Methylocapsa sp.]|nr:phage holin family protein [Methylocapsa sp.]
MDESTQSSAESSGTQEGRSIPDIFGELFRQLTALIRAETQLVRSETSEKISQIGASLGLLIAGAALLIPGITIILRAIVDTIDAAGLGDGWSSLIVGGATVIIGTVLAIGGKRLFNASRLVPRKTIEQIEHDASTAMRHANAAAGKPRRTGRGGPDPGFPGSAAR